MNGMKIGTAACKKILAAIKKQLMDMNITPVDAILTQPDSLELQGQEMVAHDFQSMMMIFDAKLDSVTKKWEDKFVPPDLPDGGSLPGMPPGVSPKRKLARGSAPTAPRPKNGWKKSTAAAILI